VRRSIYKYCSIVCLIALSWRPDASFADTSVSESAVKAAIIFKIAKFVTWPDSVFDADDEPLSVCMMSDSPMAEAMSALQGRLVRGHPISIRKLDRLGSVATDCQILYLHEDRTEPARAVLNSVAQSPVLTVGDSDAFSERGGIVSLSIERNRVRFAINLEASEKAGLEISAQLLQVARIVRTVPDSNQDQP